MSNTIVAGRPKAWHMRLKGIAETQGFELHVDVRAMQDALARPVVWMGGGKPPRIESPSVRLTLRREVVPGLVFEHHFDAVGIDRDGVDSHDPELIVADAMRELDALRARFGL